MGLDITAYSNLVYVGSVPELEADEPDWPSVEYDEYEKLYRSHHEAYCYTDFARHALMGVPNQRQDPQFAAFTTAGYFRDTDKTERHGFHAGSYGSYGRWRDDMRAKYNPDMRPEGPFYGLLSFADNEGTLWTMACASLLAAFRAHEQEHRLSWLGHEHGEYQIELYLDWMRAFELGSQGGLVDFH